MGAVLARIALVVTLVLVALPINQATAGQIGAPCALIVDWIKKRDRVIELSGLLEQRDTLSTFILLRSDRNAERDDIEALAKIVLGLKPRLLIMHLSSFFNQRELSESEAMAQFLTLVEANSDEGYRPEYVIYSRTPKQNGIESWTGLDAGIFEGRLSTVTIPRRDKAQAASIAEEVAASRASACPPAS